ncbi:leucine-rich repeat domain-containing protein [Dyadobacter sp. 22481]|uniref:leucine-rich repeat domain-containing protein n=1 Tax=Dyadobacter sp. 22481 TaxID=3453926 RepID=UPI003F8729C0
MKKCLLVLLCLFISLQSYSQSLETDRLALIAFYQATGGDNWFNNTGWTVPGNPGDNPCGWYGVTCEGGRVTSLIMEQNDAYGAIPAAVGSLTALKHLDLSGAGDELPQFQGNLPAELGNLTNLEYLDISENRIEGPNIQVIGNLTNLKHLSITPYWNVPASFANLTNLEYLRMAAEDYPFPTSTNLGSIPSFFGTFTKLKTLILRNAHATGSVPSSIGLLSNLEVLDLSQNALTGTIPASFNNLTKLTKLDLSYNNLTGPIPNILGIPVAAEVRINNNAFNFSGMESNISRLDQYLEQDLIDAQLTYPLCLGCTAASIEVYAGGTEANNTYKLFKNNVLTATQTGDRYIDLDGEGIYRVEVTNSLVPGLTLITKDHVSVRLPVTLVSFEGKSESNQTKLTWKTTSETNNKGFEIERSADARTFEKIGFVDGSGDTKDDQFYHFTDLSPLATCYYRLKQLDYDGKSEYSKIIKLKRSDAVFKIYPNPASYEVIASGFEGVKDLQVVNETGRIVLKTQADAGKPVSVQSLKPGLYTIQIGTDTRRLLISK